MFDDDEEATAWTRARDMFYYFVIGLSVFAFCAACDFADIVSRTAQYKAAWTWLR